NRLDELLETMEYLREAAPGRIAILDAKRGDIGSTADQYAREANSEIPPAREGVPAQEEVFPPPRSALFPKVPREARQSRSMAPAMDPLYEKFPDLPDRFFMDRFDGVLRARLSLINTRSLDDWKLSRLTLTATEWQLQETTQAILEQIAILYFTHWRNERRMNVIDANLERDRVLLQIATDQKNAGVATALDVTRAEVGLAGNELDRLQQETTVLQSALTLKQVLALPLGRELELTAEPYFEEETAIAFSEDRFRKVLQDRPDYQALVTKLDRESLALRAARREHLPSMELSGQWGYLSESWSDPMEEQWNIQLGVSVPVFEGFRIDAGKRLAASSLRQREIELEDLESRIEAEYRLRLQQLQSSARQVRVAQRTRDLSEREFELERIRFEEGVADNSNVVIAQTNLADAEDVLVEAEFQYILARINLARAEGDVLQVLDVRR
ncbi:MAG: TolC family protein, partial [Puniceicoccaceae bacterium]